MTRDRPATEGALADLWGVPHGTPEFPEASGGTAPLRPPPAGPLADPAGDAPLLLTAVLGRAVEPRWHDLLHLMEHEGRVEHLLIPEAEVARRRMRLASDRGRDCAVALPRDQILSDGAVLHFSADLAIIARVDSGARLRLTPATVADALRLGHWCGNLHWKVVFGPGWMEVVMEGPEARYCDRLRDLEGLAAFTVA